MSQNGTDPAIAAELRAAQRRAHEAAAEHQAQGQGTPVPAADTHPLVPDGVNGRRTT